MTTYGYIRLSRDDDRKPDRLDADWAAVVNAQAAYLARGYSAGEVVTDDHTQLKTAVAKRPGGFRVGRLAQRGDVILTPNAGRLARSMAELQDTLTRWHGAGVVGVVIDLNLDFGTPEGRTAMSLMATGAALDRSINSIDKTNNLTDDQKLIVPRWGLALAPKTKRGTVVPAELELAARCAAWHAGGANPEKIALHLTRIREPLPMRWRGRNRTRFGPPPFWQPGQIKKMIHSYHVVAGLFTRGAVKAPKGFVLPTAEPTTLPETRR